MNESSGVGQKGAKEGERQLLRPCLTTPHTLQPAFWKPSLTFGLVRGLLWARAAWAFLSQCCHPGLAGLFMHCLPSSLAAPQR